MSGAFLKEAPSAQEHRIQDHSKLYLRNDDLSPVLKDLHSLANKPARLWLHNMFKYRGIHLSGFPRCSLYDVVGRDAVSDPLSITLRHTTHLHRMYEERYGPLWRQCPGSESQLWGVFHLWVEW